MANIVRNDLTIEGPNVQRVLDYIGFKKPSTLTGLNELVLIDLHRLGHEFGCEWPMPYGGYVNDHIGDDLFDLKDNKVSFKFYTKNTHAQRVLWALSEKFPKHKFTCQVWELANDLIGGEVLERGEQTCFVDIHFHASFCSDYEEPPNPECNVPGCSVMFPPSTEAQLTEYRKGRAQEAKKDASERFEAEEAE